jgi:hypothetical protein
MAVMGGGVLFSGTWAWSFVTYMQPMPWVFSDSLALPVGNVNGVAYSGDEDDGDTSWHSVSRVPYSGRVSQLE